MDTSRKNPVVFISSTCYDLKQVRADMKEFLRRIMVLKQCFLNLILFR